MPRTGLFDTPDEFDRTFRHTARSRPVAASEFRRLDDSERDRVFPPRGPHIQRSTYDEASYSEYDDDMFDDDGPDFDEFDASLLRQPYDDRRRQAEAGLVRLSFPRASQATSRAPPATLRPIAQYAYDPQDTSSPPATMTSSPTLDASRRTSCRGPPRTQAALPSRPRNAIDLSHAPPMVQGIPLVPVTELPDRLRTVFPFDMFNAIQSKCYDAIFRTDKNCVLSSPTGSGKTVIFELAICRLMAAHPDGQYKIVYQAPTKSLCSERQRDWGRKLAPLGLKCAEMTGDSDNAQLRSVQNASVVITTPEKWDSMTRKWKDHEKLMRLVKLFLIDEVHILKDDRGATLEAVVSRMKSVGSDVRFVALSATIPNSRCVATWLGESATNPQAPAVCETFGEEFRPVKLQKHVVGFGGNYNDFAFEKVLSSKLHEIIVKYSHKKPIMIFCFTRKSASETAKQLSNWWTSSDSRQRFWPAPKRIITVGEGELRGYVPSAVAFHHAGIDARDREAVEKGFLNGDINVICCTSTLAVGVNLPCHMVIIKNTLTWQGGACKEYADIEIVQMLGRAGRPQFDTSAVAVIMTRQEKVKHYEKMVSGQEVLESCMHVNLIEHLNSEIGLGTIVDFPSAKVWLESTFLYVRLNQNPQHYKLQDDNATLDIDKRLEKICSRDISLLQECDLISASPKLKATEFGDAMARYYVQFETMKVILGLPPQPKLSEILSVIAQAAEFKEVRFKSGEKPMYKNANQSPLIKYPILVDLSQPMHKVSLLIQATLGGAELGFDDKYQKLRLQVNTDTAIVFQHISRLIRCIIDCQVHLNDAIGARNALSLARSFSARAWDDSPLQMKQIESIGPVAVRKLANQGIKSIEALECTEPHKIETILGKYPPYGNRILDRVSEFPKLRVSLQMRGYQPGKEGEGVRVNVRAELGFMNEKPPIHFKKRPVYVCFLAETSDGHKIHFCRISAEKLNKGQDVLFSATLSDPKQSISCYIMCDELAGTLRQATLIPEIPKSCFPRSLCIRNQLPQRTRNTSSGAIPNTSRRRRSEVELNDSDEYGFGSIADSDLIKAAGEVEGGSFLDVDQIPATRSPQSKRRKLSNAHAIPARTSSHTTKSAEQEDWQPTQLRNGKWACNHRCVNKTQCKHMCCREGTDKPPKPPASKKAPAAVANAEGTLQRSTRTPRVASQNARRQQQTLELSTNRAEKEAASPRLISARDIQRIDLTEDAPLSRNERPRAIGAQQGLRNLQILHEKSLGGSKQRIESTPRKKQPVMDYADDDPTLQDDIVDEDLLDVVDDLPPHHHLETPAHEFELPEASASYGEYTMDVDPIDPETYKGNFNREEASATVGQDSESSKSVQPTIREPVENPMRREQLSGHLVGEAAAKGKLEILPTSDSLPDLPNDFHESDTRPHSSTRDYLVQKERSLFVTGLSSESVAADEPNNGRESRTAIRDSPKRTTPGVQHGTVPVNTSIYNKNSSNSARTCSAHQASETVATNQAEEKPANQATESAEEWFLREFGHCCELI